MSFGITSTILAADVANSGTFTVGYPAGTNQGFYINGLAGAGHVLIVNGNDQYTTGFTLAFGASNITVTNASLGTLPAGAAISLQIQRQGPDTFQGTFAGDNDVVNLAFTVTLAAAAAANQDIINSVALGMRGTIEHMQYVPDVAGATGSNVVLNPRIGGTNVTGGAVTLAAANTAVRGAAVQGTAITANNQLNVDSLFSVRATAVTTAFTAGSGTLLVRVRRAPSAG